MLKALKKAEMAFRSGLLLFFPLFLFSFPDQHVMHVLSGQDQVSQPETAVVEAATVQSNATLALAETRKQPPTIQDVLLEVCQNRGYGEECGKTLLGMLWKESLGDSTAVGDQGRSHGYFQIQTKLHKVPLECTQDLVCSANWTLDYLELHSYPRYVAYAVQCHNGCLINNGYAASAMRHGVRLWNEPMPYKLAISETN